MRRFAFADTAKVTRHTLVQLAERLELALDEFRSRNQRGHFRVAADMRVAKKGSFDFVADAEPASGVGSPNPNQPLVTIPHCLTHVNKATRVASGP